MRGATWAQNVAEAPGQRPAYVSDFYGLVGFAELQMPCGREIEVCSPSTGEQRGL